MAFLHQRLSQACLKVIYIDMDLGGARGSYAVLAAPYQKFETISSDNTVLFTGRCSRFILWRCVL